MHLTTKHLASAIPTKRGRNRFCSLRSLSILRRRGEKKESERFLIMQDLKYSCDVENILIEVKTHNYMQSESKREKMEGVCAHDLFKRQLIRQSSDYILLFRCLPGWKMAAFHIAQQLPSFIRDGTQLFS